MRLPDRRRSRAVLIGTGRYADGKLPDLPAVGRTIGDLVAALTDPVYGVIPENHCTVLEDQADIRLIGRHLRSAASQAEDLLLVYFVGHGLVGGRRHELYLGLPDSEWAEPEFNSLEYDKLRGAVLDSAAATKIIILDCCFSGRVASEAMADPVTEMVGQIEVDGTYVLASAGRDQVALILPGEDHTAFTGRFLRMLRDGVPGGPELLTIDYLYRQLAMRMKAEGLSQPQKRGTSTADLLALAVNRVFAATTAPRTGRPQRGPDWPDRIRNTRTRDTRITGYEPLVSPAMLRVELPLSDPAIDSVEQSRAEVRAVLDGSDDRLLVIAGPCSVHDPVAALDYAGRLKVVCEARRADLLIVMWVDFENPRTVTGWTGLINDPDMDGSYNVNRGLRTARRLLLDIISLGLPVGCEWLDPITPHYIADAVTWGALDASTTESQVHLELASGLSMPVGFKNSTRGDVQVAVDACRGSARGHTFFDVSPDGAAAVVMTAGNPDTHVIMSGGRSGPNYEASHTAKALDLIAAAGLPRRLMVDASHGNSGKDHRRQPVVAASIAEQVAAGEGGLTGVMLESFLCEGKQEPGSRATLTYGQSVTDACMDFDTTDAVLTVLAAAIRARRSLLQHHSEAGRK